MVSKLRALAIANPTEFVNVLRGALIATGSVPKAAVYLSARDYPATRALLFALLREHPEVVNHPDVHLPRDKGLHRGESRQDKVEGWEPSPATIERRTKRHEQRA